MKAKTVCENKKDAEIEIARFIADILNGIVFGNKFLKFSKFTKISKTKFNKP